MTGGDHELEPAEADTVERVAKLEEQVGVLAELVEQMAAQLAEPRRPKWRQRPFNPLAISAPAVRADAWERLYVFVEMLNSVFGAYRSTAKTAPLYVRSGWWDNPIAVMYLAALCEAWVEAEFTRGDEPLAGGHDMLWLLMERAVPVLELVCGRNAGEAAHWSQQDQPLWSLEPPALMADREERRREEFEAFVAGDAPVPARTGFACWMAEELNPQQRGQAVGDEDAPPPDEPPQDLPA